MTSEHTTSDLASVRERMRAWRQGHPRASLTEIEQELDRQLDAARALLLSEVAGSGAEDLGPCPECGGRLVRRGERERRLATRGDEALTLQRPYASCTRCGRGLFPPG